MNINNNFGLFHIIIKMNINNNIDFLNIIIKNENLKKLMNNF